MSIGKELVHARNAGRLSRRRFGQLAAALGVGVVTMPVLQRPARAAGEITYFGWSGYEDPNFHKGYIDKYGGSPNFSFWGSEDEAREAQKIHGGRLRSHEEVNQECRELASEYEPEHGSTYRPLSIRPR